MIKRVLLDGQGFVIFEFETQEECQAFVGLIPNGTAYAMARLSQRTPCLRVSWKLSDLGNTVQTLELMDADS